nr:protein DEHYDRATION-INDUCED 19 homolog 5-like isoform X2 [Ipomoea batatas]
MDIDFWAARVHSTKHHSAVQANRVTNSDTYMNMGNEGAEDLRAWFPCPFCYIEIEVPVLCSHLQEEHCFDLKNAVCPICAATLGKDPISHFTVQHAQSVKRRRKYQKSGFWNNATAAMIGRDLRDLTGSNIINSHFNGQEPAPDPLLLPFLPNVPHSDSESMQEDNNSCYVATATDTQSSKQHLSDPAREEDNAEKRKRAAFLQELMASTIFLDH